VRALLQLAVGASLALAGCGNGSSGSHGTLDDFGSAPPVSGGGGSGKPTGGGTSFDPTMSWPGFAEGSTELSQITLGSYRDTDGSKGIRVLLVAEVSFSCAACVTESMDIATKLATTWHGQGVKVLQLVVDDPAGGGATTDSVRKWQQATGSQWAVAADPKFSFSHEGSNPMPQVLIIDPRNLTQALRVEGYDLPSLTSGVAALVKQNGG
jgi:hypothetical protein